MDVLWKQNVLWPPSDGLVYVRRTPVPKKNGEGFFQENKNEIIGGPLKDPNEIAQQLGLKGAEDLDSFEHYLKQYRVIQVQ